MHDQPSRTLSLRLSLLASIGLVIILGAGLTWYKGHRTATAAVASQPRRPDVVVILTDDQFYNTLWSMPIVRSQLLRKGVRFANMFASNPLCAPSRASILTGQYSHTTGVYDNAPSSFGSAEAFHDSGYESSTMATWFHAAGYRTGIVGKYVNGFAGGWTPPGLGRVGDRRRVLGADAVRERRQAHLSALDVRDDAARRQGRRVHHRRAARQAAAPLSGAVRAARERLAGAEVRPPPGRPRPRLAVSELRRGRRVGQALVHPQHPAPRRVRSLGGELAAPAPVPDAALGGRHGREGVGCSEDPRLVAEHDPRIHE